MIISVETMAGVPPFCGLVTLITGSTEPEKICSVRKGKADVCVLFVNYNNRDGEQTAG